MPLSALIIAVLALATASYAVWRLVTLERRMSASLGDGSDGSLGQTLAAHLERVEQVDRRLVQLNEAYGQLTVANGLASQKIALVRFNPFGDTGGDQSFSLAVLDSHDSGYVLTSIHGREGTRVYVKPIDYGKSKYTLSAEEQQALTKAAQRVPQV